QLLQLLRGVTFFPPRRFAPAGIMSYLTPDVDHAPTTQSARIRSEAAGATAARTCSTARLYTEEARDGTRSPPCRTRPREPPGDLPAGDQRDTPAGRREGKATRLPSRRRGQRGPRPDGAVQPAPGRQHRPRLRRQGPGAAGPDRGGEPGP